MAPAGLPDGPALAGYGAAVRAALRGWFGTEGATDGTVETYYGPQSAHELLERTVWHAAQHLRQIHALLEDAGRPAAASRSTRRSWRGSPSRSRSGSSRVRRARRAAGASGR